MILTLKDVHKNVSCTLRLYYFLYPTVVAGNLCYEYVQYTVIVRSLNKMGFLPIIDETTSRKEQIQKSVYLALPAADLLSGTLNKEE